MVSPPGSAICNQPTDSQVKMLANSLKMWGNFTASWALFSAINKHLQELFAFAAIQREYPLFIMFQIIALSVSFQSVLNFCSTH